MSERNVRRESDGDSTAEPGSSETGGQTRVATLKQYARRGIRSGIVAGIVGGVFTLRGFGALKRREWGRGVLYLAAGGLSLAVARAQWAGKPPFEKQAGEQTTVSTFTESDAVDQTIDIESPGETASDTESEAESDGAKYEAEAESGTATDAGSETEATPDDETYERLGEAAFDEHTNEVPAPQRAFDQEYIALGGEVAWGIREADGLVFLSQDYDAIEGRTGVRYVASSQVNDDRVVTVPDTITNHWNEVADSGVGVASGDDVIFATTDSDADHVLAVVPAAWSDDLDWEE